MKIQSPWDRAFIVISTLWVIAGSAIYVNALGIHYGESASVIFSGMPNILQWWSVVCWKMSIEIFEVANTPGGIEHAVSFKPTGYIAFIIGPMIVTAICTCGLKWIFDKKQ